MKFNPIKLDDIYEARQVIKPVLKPTNLIASKKYNNIYFKPENFQTTGSFKIRGAYYKISKLSEDEKQKGVIACSAGNHAQGVALACKELGIDSKIYMPTTAPDSKVNNTKSYGATVVLEGLCYDDAYRAATMSNIEEKRTFIHPFNDHDIIKGQGTIGIEIFEDLKDVDTVVIPVGGGGLISGVSVALKSLNPSIKIIGVEIEEANSMQLSLRDNKLHYTNCGRTFADGIAVNSPGMLTFEYAKRYVDKIVTVSENEIAEAIMELLSNEKFVVEGSGAVPYAAFINKKFEYKDDEKIVLMVSGGNIDVQRICTAIAMGTAVKIHKN